MKPAVLERLDSRDKIECHEGIQLPSVQFLILADVSQLLQTVSSGLGGHIESVNHILDKAEVVLDRISYIGVSLCDDPNGCERHEDGGGQTVGLPFHTLLIRPVFRIGFLGGGAVNTALDHRSQGRVEDRHLIRVIGKETGMQNVVAGLVAEGKAVAVLLVFFQQTVVNDDSPRFRSNVFGPLIDRVKDRHLVGVVEYSHAEVDPIVGKELVVRSHAEITLDEAIDIHGGWILQNLRLEVTDESFSNGIKFLFADNGNTVLLDSEGGIVHRRLLPLSLFEFLYKPQPVSLACIQVTSGAQCRGDIIPFHDIFRKVGSDRVAHLAGQV